MPLDRIHEAIRHEHRLRELISRQATFATTLADTLANPRAGAAEIHLMADFIDQHARNLQRLAADVRTMAPRYEETP